MTVEEWIRRFEALIGEAEADGVDVEFTTCCCGGGLKLTKGKESEEI